MSLHDHDYRHHRIEVDDVGGRLELFIDGQRIATTASRRGDGYATNLLPYKSFPDLVSLGRAVIRAGHWAGVSHGRPK